MSSSNNLPDLPDEADVKKRQMIVISVILLFVVAVLGYIFLTNPNAQISRSDQAPPVEIDYATPGKSNDPIQNWVLQNENQLKAFEAQRTQEKSEADERYHQLLQEINRLKQVNARTTQPAEPFKTGSSFPSIPLPPRESLKVNAPEVLALPGSGETKSNASIQSAGKGSKTLVDQVMAAPRGQSRIVKIKFDQKNAKKKAHIRDTIPAGSFGQAVLLSGLDAPTGGLAERNPHPVLLELLNNGNLPNRYRHKVKQCRVVASGTGNISDERAYLRLERLTCVLRNGDIISEVATGTITGEDGKNGLRGRLVTKQGQLIANAFLAGALSGVGDAISQSFTTVATSPNGVVSSLDTDRLLEAGLSSGLGNTMEKIADWYFKRAEETYPIIEVSAGRIVNLFLTEDLALNANLLAKHTPESIDE